MKQLSLCFLATRPLDNSPGYSLPHYHSSTTCTEARSSRSQVRALPADAHPFSREPAAGVRVSGHTPTPIEAVPAANNGDERLLLIRSTTNSIEKRSLKRALRRADRDGVATYRGRRLLHWTPTFEPQFHQQPKEMITRSIERIRVVEWNCGGLSQEIQLQWFAWLKQDPSIGIFVLAETHWSFSGDYEANGWVLVHSGLDGKRGSGVLIGVRADLTDRASLKWDVLEPGRLLHVRCIVARQQFDSLGLYQHALAWTAQEQQDALMQKRSRIWKQLDAALAGFPFRRSSLLVAGDFNMVCSRRGNQAR